MLWLGETRQQMAFSVVLQNVAYRKTPDKWLTNHNSSLDRGSCSTVRVRPGVSVKEA